ncbi:MAG: hypothetical protein WB919_22225 [Candidatus Sulfotelmatobacter sp.]
MISSSGIQARVRISAVLILAGLLVELLSLRWVQPSAFLVFAMVGFPVVFLGILFFLYSLVSAKADDSN